MKTTMIITDAAGLALAAGLIGGLATMIAINVLAWQDIPVVHVATDRGHDPSPPALSSS